MAIIFPGELLRPRSLTFGVIGQTAGGGATLVGPEQAAELAGGGFWTLSYDLGDRADPARLRLLRALLVRMRGGATEIVMPFCDEPQAPWPLGTVPRNRALTAFSDGAAFADGARFSQSPIVFTLEEAVAENDTEALVRRILGADLTGGEMFTWDHPTAGARAYCLGAVQQEDDDLFRIAFDVPAREDVPAGADCDFAWPRCTMKFLPGPEGGWPTITRGWKAQASWRFVESFDYLREVD